MKSGLIYLCVFLYLFLIGCTPNPNRVQTIEGYQYSSDGSHVAEADPDTVSSPFSARVLRLAYASWEPGIATTWSWAASRKHSLTSTWLTSTIRLSPRELVDSQWRRTK